MIRVALKRLIGRKFRTAMTGLAIVLGNFPHAFTHLALISAGHHLDRALDSRGSSA
jgi:hypothetical protein